MNRLRVRFPAIVFNVPKKGSFSPEVIDKQEVEPNFGIIGLQKAFVMNGLRLKIALMGRCAELQKGHCRKTALQVIHSSGYTGVALRRELIPVGN